MPPLLQVSRQTLGALFGARQGLFEANASDICPVRLSVDASLTKSKRCSSGGFNGYLQVHYGLVCVPFLGHREKHRHDLGVDGLKPKAH
jgi:hypothetical protein